METISFFNGAYDKSVARFAEANKQPFAMAELLTATNITTLPFSFKGPAMVSSRYIWASTSGMIAESLHT